MLWIVVDHYFTIDFQWGSDFASCIVLVEKGKRTKVCQFLGWGLRIGLGFEEGRRKKMTFFITKSVGKDS